VSLQAYFEGGCIIVIMEFMDGGTLAHLLQRLRVIEEPYLAVLARQVQCWRYTPLKSSEM
jgi:mitogen-activated protein kinase kinase 2